VFVGRIAVNRGTETVINQINQICGGKFDDAILGAWKPLAGVSVLRNFMYCSSSMPSPMMSKEVVRYVKIAADAHESF
jgi:hypothetical protein